MDKLRLVPFSFKRINNQYLIVNITGDFAFLSDKDFNDLVNLKPNVPALENRFYYTNANRLNGIICKYRKTKQYLGMSTSLFIVVVTNRCNLNCIYCQASKINSSDTKYDMDYLTAKKTVDLILQFPGKSITIEFQGGEPLLNFAVIKFIVEYIKEKRADKVINFSIVSNLIAIDHEKIDFLIENKISLCTSCDGNKVVQDYNRPLKGKSCFDVLEEKIHLIKKVINNKNIGINGILTTSKKTLSYPKEVIDEYLRLGLNSIYIRPINPFGLAKKAFSKIGYTPYEFLEFYKKCLNYIIKVNRQGTLFIEGTAQIFLKKILGKHGVNHMEYRSPCGAAIGQIAINYDGNIYTCDEGRMMAQAGDDSFKIGEIDSSSYDTLFDNEVTKTMCLSSCMEGFPRCNRCVYLPYCGVCPIINYTEEGDIFKNNAFRCLVNEGIIDHLFMLINSDVETKNIFSTWVN